MVTGDETDKDSANEKFYLIVSNLRCRENLGVIERERQWVFGFHSQYQESSRVFGQKMAANDLTIIVMLVQDANQGRRRINCRSPGFLSSGRIPPKVGH